MTLAGELINKEERVGFMRKKDRETCEECKKCNGTENLGEKQQDGQGETARNGTGGNSVCDVPEIAAEEQSQGENRSADDELEKLQLLLEDK